MYRFEHTDTFGGEANYSWVKRHDYKPAKADPSRLSLIRAAKAWAGLSGVRCKVYPMGEGWEIRPAGLCQVVFIYWHDATEARNYWP